MNYLKLTVAFLLLSFNFSHAQISSGTVDVEKNYDFRAAAELGFLGVIDNKIQYGQGANSTYFDYREQGGQDVLFAVSRLSLELDWNERNTVIFLYQPLTLESKVTLREDILMDDVFFAAGTSMDLLYNFPFWRLSYLRHLNIKNEKIDLAIGASLQIRNAKIEFASGDGTLLKSNRDIGPVPVLKLRGRYHQSKNTSTEIEIDGMYAPISYLNGSDNEVVGGILDASIRQNLRINNEVNGFLNLRYLGGGAEGTSDDTTQVTDGYTKNWLHFFTVSAGFVYQF
jgi:hypothetical protein